MDEEKKKSFKTMNVVIIAIALITVITLMTNAYAATAGYGNIFFMIKTIFSDKEVVGQENLLSDREITISYSSIELAEGLKVQIQKIVLEENQSKLYIYVQDDNIGKTTLHYKIYDETERLIADYKSKNAEEMLYYTDEIIIPQKVLENAKLKLEIYDSQEKLLSTMTIDLDNKEILVNGEEVIDKQSEVELKRYLGAFAILSDLMTIDNYEEAMTGGVISTAETLNEEILHKKSNSQRELINNIIDSYYWGNIEKEGDIIKLEQGGDYIYDMATDSYELSEAGRGTMICLDITDMSYKNKVYTVKFVYGANGIDIEEEPQYEATAQLKINADPEYSKYKLISLTKGTLVKEKSNPVPTLEIPEDTIPTLARPEIEDTFNETDENIYENENNYTYQVLNDEQNIKKYVVRKSENNYEAILDISNYHYIGIYNNKLYFSSNESIQYIDLSKEKIEQKIWLSLPYLRDPEIQSNYSIFQSTIVGDTLYFSFSSSGVLEKYEGILSLSMKARNFDDYNQIIPEAHNITHWYFNKNSIIYTSGNIVYEYNVKTGKNSKLIEEVQYQLGNPVHNGKMLYYNYDNGELYVLDINTKKSILVSANIKNSMQKALSGNYLNIADIMNDKIYFIANDNKIHFYDISNNTYNDYGNLKTNFYGFRFVENNTIKMYFRDNKEQFMINGVYLNYPETVNIKMLDNSIKEYTIYSFE